MSILTHLASHLLLTVTERVQQLRCMRVSKQEEQTKRERVEEI